MKALIDGGTGTSDLVLGLSALPQVPQNLLAAIPQVQLASPSTYRYLRQTVRTSNAAVVAAGAEKPVSPMSITKSTAGCGLSRTCPSRSASTRCRTWRRWPGSCRAN